jgi:hypothetical protein
MQLFCATIARENKKVKMIYVPKKQQINPEITA